ncbi:hypothetical protein HBA54_25960 [Pelagibius litoralis]|uniref:Uncharacterized protein n=1 Tax=Pelagibius litoralis TaxID=374515 RepID=A0A967F380_9PROT|nr:hypothetical protein [Pelagibius litoralis]NIA72051.1 hypothetical protein [Pelagibius litoralis]
MSGFSKSILFLSSYAPLFAILAIKYYPVDCQVSLLAGIMTVVSILLFAGLFIGLSRTSAPQSIEVKTVGRRDSELLSYAITYFLPFLSLDLSNRYDLAAFLLLYAVIWLTYVRANAVHINPLFHVLGYRLFEIEDKPSGRLVTVITKSPFIRPNEVITVKLETSHSVGIQV